MRRTKPLNTADPGQEPGTAKNGDELTYVAAIAISLPGTDTVSAQVVLSPADQVEVDQRVMPLSDCTLGDIATFADKLEADVWEAYQSIRLVDLDGNEDSQIEVTVQDRTGRTIALTNWKHQAVLLPRPEPEIELPPNDVAVTSHADSFEVTEAEGTDETGEHLQTVDASGDVPADVVETEAESELVQLLEPFPVTVSASEPVFQEREAADDPNAYPTPAVAPSRARVRIAGRRLPPGHATWSAVDILIDEPALRSAQAHALSSPDREVAGVLLGPPPEKQPDGRYVVHIFDTIIAKYTIMHGASVTYTPESWRYLNDKLAERYPDETAVMAGWYHTHPGFGIFLSGMDQFIHQNFFTQIWHIALVLDPVAHSSGFFGWDRKQSRVARYDFDWPGWAADSW